jgi:hypothetical protein
MLPLLLGFLPSFSYANAWDSVPSIQKYVLCLEQHLQNVPLPLAQWLTLMSHEGARAPPSETGTNLRRVA